MEFLIRIVNTVALKVDSMVKKYSQILSKRNVQLRVLASLSTPVAILKTQPAQTTSKIKISSYSWRIYVLVMKFRRSAQ
jgi:hypothetical protein